MNTLKKHYTKNFILLVLLLLSSFLPAQVTINGTIAREDGIPVENVVVSLIGSAPQEILTDANGFYEFSVPAGGDYIVAPFYDLFPLNGVNTIDSDIITDHVFAVENLDSNFKLIAADVTNDGVISTLDIIRLGRVLDGTETSFANNTSWRFFSTASVFPNPDDPFEIPNIIESVDLFDLQADTIGVDFTAVKVGDVDNSAITVLPVGACNLSCGNLKGNIFYDLNNDCLKDTSEQNLSNWLVEISDGTNSFYTYTNQSGNYEISLFPTDYTVSVTPPSSAWGLCQNSYSVTLIEGVDVVQDFAASAFFECPNMSVELSTDVLRPCFDRVYFVNYCNDGTTSAEDVYIEVTFDSLISINESTPPWTSQDGNTYTFEIGEVGVNECGVIAIDYLLDCETELGQTLCSTAQIFPDSLCPPVFPGWDGSSLELTSECNGDSVSFQITNIGDPMLEVVQYIVIEDDMIMMMDDDEIQLNENESIFVSVPANGSTWRLEVDQTENNPLSERVSAAIEGCGQNGDGTVSLGFINLFPQFSSSPNIDEDCEVVVGSYDPNDKAATPEGVGTEHFIEKNVDLKYKIRFQNTGTDTAFTVVIRDTISNWLNVSSIQPLNASHDYRFNFLDGNIVEFEFSNIMLPDSNINEPASHGFVNFSIEQKTDNPIGTLIENRAGIYFDFNEPIITNTVFHTIGENFLEVIDHVLLEPGQVFNIKLSPNPVNTSATLSFEGLDLKDGRFMLFDLYGRILRQERFTGNTLEFYKNNLSSGMYIFEIEEGGQRLSSGKLMIR